MADEAANAELKRREANPGCAIVLVLIALMGPAIAYAQGWGWIGWSLTSLPAGLILLMALGSALPEGEDDFRRRQKRQNAVNESKRSEGESGPSMIAESEQESERVPEVEGGKGMSIKVVCPSCGTPAEVPDNAAGMKGKCRKCGAVVRIPAAQVTKVCVGCRKDVAQQRRSKNQQGNYYCEACWGNRADAQKGVGEAGGTKRYGSQLITFDYPSEWYWDQVEKDQSAHLNVVGFVLRDGNDNVTGAVTLICFHDKEAVRLETLVEGALQQYQEMDEKEGKKFRFRRRLVTERHLLGHLDGNPIYGRRGGFECDRGDGDGALRRQVLIITNDRGLTINVSAGVRAEAWAACLRGIEKVISTVRLTDSFLHAITSADGSGPTAEGRPASELSDQMWSLVQFFIKTSDVFFDDLQSMRSQHGIKLGEAGRFEVRAYLTQQLYFWGMMNEYPLEPLLELVRGLATITAGLLPDGRENMERYAELFMQRLALYDGIIRSERENVEMMTEASNRLVDLLLFSGRGDAPKPIMKQFVGTGEAKNAALAIGVMTVSAHAGMYWMFGVKELFAKTPNIEAIPIAEFDKRLERGVEKGKRAFEQMRGDLERL